MFDVPLAAYLQKKSPAEQRGTILAANNFLIFTGMFAHSILFGMLGAPVREGSIQNIEEIRATSEGLSADELLEIEKICSVFDGHLEAASAEKRESGMEPPGFYQILLGAENPKVTAKKNADKNGKVEDELRIEFYMEGNPDLPRGVLYAHLLWTEFSHKKENGELGTLAEYYERFPDDKPLSQAVFRQIGGIKRFDSRQIFVIMGLATIPVFVFVIWRLPLASLRFDAWWVLRFIYRIRIRNEQHVPENMGAIVICNHISWLDRTLFLLFSPRRIRLVSFTKPQQGLKEKWWRFWGMIRIAGGPSTIQQSLAEARKALAHGELLILFPEEKVSTTGALGEFHPDLQLLLDKSPVPIIPAHIDEIWGSLFTYERGRLFWKIPQRIRQPVSLEFGEPLPRPTTVFETRQALQKLGANNMSDEKKFVAPARQFIRRCKQRKFKTKLSDLAEGEVSGGMYLTNCLVLRKLLRKHVLGDDEERVGILLPPSKGGAVVNMTLALDKRVAVNLNYSASEEIINACIKAADIKHVLTSKQVMSKLGLNLDAEVIELESLRNKVSKFDKFVAASQAYAMPAAILESSLGLKSIQPDDLSTIIFTSGSTGTPKGVMLTQNNIASNVQSFQKVIHLKPSDVLMGILPFFHSFGYTVTLWGNSMLDTAAAYHYTPLDGRQVGKLCDKFKGTVLVSTPTFLRGYLKRTKEEQFKTLEVVIAGAEKLPPELADAFEEKFRIRPVEGYGTTELSPVVSVNVPPGRAVGGASDGCKEGTIGRPIPDVAAKIVDLDTGEELGPNQAGMLWIKGPNVMKGYYHREDLTNEVLKDGWYETGDVAQIDEQGFISITGRISRFSKIGGEMVPHVQIEEVLNELIGIDDEEGIKAVVTAVPDEKKGERLVVVHTELDKSVDELRKGMSEKGLPNLYIPSGDSFVQVEEIPVLGTGKMDLKGIQKLAVEKFS